MPAAGIKSASASPSSPGVSLMLGGCRILIPQPSSSSPSSLHWVFSWSSSVAHYGASGFHYSSVRSNISIPP